MVIEAYFQVSRFAIDFVSSLCSCSPKFNNVGRAIILAFSTWSPQVILSTSCIRWIILQPDSVLSPAPIHDEVGQPAFAFQCESLHGDHTVYTLLRRDLAKPSVPCSL